MTNVFDYNAQMINYWLQSTVSEKIAFSEVTNWHKSHPHYRLNYYNDIQISQVLGIYMLFNKNFLSLFGNIVEIGSYNGGLSSYLYNTKPKSTSFVSYDIDPSLNTTKQTDIDFRIGDCFDENTKAEIISHIRQDGRTLMICDGGHKSREFNLYSEYLKPDDVIILHDYKHSEESFTDATNFWQWPYGCETEYSAIKDAVLKNGLVDYEQTVFNFYLWGSYLKK